jgi:hypothetical protein
MTKALAYVLALAAPLAFMSPALAEQLSGTIKSVDKDARTIVLEDGAELGVAEGVGLDALESGTTVKMTVEERDGKRVITGVERSPD